MDSNILSIILYGSYARNDHDTASDYDVCVLTKNRQNYGLDLEEIKRIIGDPQKSQLNLVCYSSPVVDSMLEHGSLFLWHLRIEGKVLYGEDYFINKIKKLNSFRSHHEEIIYHTELFDDLTHSWKYICLPNELDLSLLFTIARNTCMILSHKMGKPSFGRLNSYSTAKTLFHDLPLSIDEYLYLSNWKTVYERNSEKNYVLPSVYKYKIIINKMEKLLQYADKKTE